MTVELGVVISIASLGIAFASFFFNRKKENKTDGFELGQFMGEIKSEIKSIKDMITDIKADTKEFDNKIKDAMQEHIEIYHKGGK